MTKACACRRPGGRSTARSRSDHVRSEEVSGSLGTVAAELAGDLLHRHPRVEQAEKGAVLLEGEVEAVGHDAKGSVV